MMIGRALRSKKPKVGGKRRLQVREVEPEAFINQGSSRRERRLRKTACIDWEGEEKSTRGTDRQIRSLMRVQGGGTNRINRVVGIKKPDRCPSGWGEGEGSRQGWVGPIDERCFQKVEEM